MHLHVVVSAQCHAVPCRAVRAGRIDGRPQHRCNAGRCVARRWCSRCSSPCSRSWRTGSPASGTSSAASSSTSSPATGRGVRCVLSHSIPSLTHSTTLALLYQPQCYSFRGENTRRLLRRTGRHLCVKIRSLATAVNTSIASARDSVSASFFTSARTLCVRTREPQLTCFY